MVISIFCVLALAGAASPVAAQEAGGEGGATGIDRILTVGVIETEPPVWDVPFLIAKPGDKVTLRADLRNSPVVHNLHVTEGAEATPEATDAVPSALHEVTFTMGDDAVTFICDVHPTMTAVVRTTAPAGGAVDVPHLGVNFLAYWVGLIAFALLFIVYGLTFFLFKHNETPATTDQWDRSDAPAGRRFGGGAASLLALVFAAVVIGAVIYLARSA